MKFLHHDILITYQPRVAIGREEVDGSSESVIVYSDPQYTAYIRKFKKSATGSSPEYALSNLLTKLEIDQLLPSKMEITNIEIT